MHEKYAGLNTQKNKEEHMYDTSKYLTGEKNAFN